MQTFVTSLLFTGDRCGQAEEAVEFYVSLFPGSRVVSIDRHGVGTGGPEGSVARALFELNGQEFQAMDSDLAHNFTFTPAVSIVVRCSSAEEQDRLFAAPSDGGQVHMPLADYAPWGRLAWVDDRFGVSWQLHLAELWGRGAS